MFERPTDYEVIEAYATLQLRRVEDDRAGVDAKINKLNTRIRDLQAARNHQIAVRECEFYAVLYDDWRDRARRKDYSAEVAKNRAERLMAEVAAARFGGYW